MIDNHTEWPGALVIPNMKENTTIKNVEVFSQFSYFCNVVTDEYSTFMEKAFQGFIRVNGTQHSTTPSRFYATNNAPEN